MHWKPLRESWYCGVEFCTGTTAHVFVRMCKIKVDFYKCTFLGQHGTVLALNFRNVTIFK